MKRRRPDGTRYPWIIRSTTPVNHYYVYILDRDFGPLFITPAHRRAGYRYHLSILQAEFALTLGSFDRASFVSVMSSGKWRALERKRAQELFDRFGYLPDLPRGRLCDRQERSRAPSATPSATSCNSG